MQGSAIAKYLFRIRTRSGVVVENLSIYGRNEGEATGKLRQIYIACEVLECRLQQASPTGRSGHVTYEDVVDLIIAS